MGLFDRKRTIETVAVTRGADVAAQIGPAPTLDAFYPFGGADYLASREEAMSVPAIARATKHDLQFNCHHSNDYAR
jgi:hypothetical protein